MHILLLTLLVGISQVIFSQKTDLNKWTKAVINIDAKSDLYEKTSMKILGEAWAKVQARTMSEQKYSFLQDSLRANSPSVTGTAIFLKYKSKRYLITAKHVVMDTQSSLKDSVLFDYIRRIPMENERTTYDDVFFGQLNKQLPNEGTYIFSSDQIDLAIISLDTRNKNFGDFLDKRRHVPLSINDIDTICEINYGEDIMCIGFPFYSFEGLQGIQDRWTTVKSKYVASLAVTFGKISVPSFHNYYFIGDINVMPGNSGGAIVRKNKLIGVVSSQPAYFIEDLSNHPLPYRYRLSIANNIKSSEIMRLLHQLRRNLHDE